MTSRSDLALSSKGKIPWYVYCIGGVIYTALGSWLFVESSLLAWMCLLSSPVGFFYAGEDGNTRHNTEVRPTRAPRLSTASPLR